MKDVTRPMFKVAARKQFKMETAVIFNLVMRNNLGYDQNFCTEFDTSYSYKTIIVIEIFVIEFAGPSYITIRSFAQKF